MTNDETKPAPDTTPAIAAAHISHAFGDIRVLDDISLAVEPGEIVALVGPNGSGKSTLLRFLAGVRTPDSGTVTRTPNDGRQIGYLPQQPSFRPGFCLKDTLGFYAKFVDDADVDAILSQVGLAEIRGQHAETLSGGQTRLLGLGQALLGDPPVVILDEPASGLDPEMVERLFALVSDLAANGTSVILSSHNLGPVERTADRVFVLHDGRFVAEGSPESLVEQSSASNLQTAFTSLIGSESMVDEPSEPTTEVPNR